MKWVPDSLANLILGAAMRATRNGPLQRFLQATKTPAATQRAVLREILQANAACAFGRAHSFADIATYDDYRAAVPVADYESLRSYIEERRNESSPTLTTEAPVFYARTSGTTGDPKYIPLTKSGIRRSRVTQRLFAEAQYSGSDMYRSKIVAIASPAVEGTMADGNPFGSATGMIYQSMPWPVRRKYVIPPEVFGIADYDVKYYTIAALALCEEDISGLATSNPSTLVRLLAVMNRHLGALLVDIADGSLSVAEHFTPAQRKAISRCFKRNPSRARRLEYLRLRKGRLTFADAWPNLAGVVTWTGGSCGIVLPALREALPEATRIIEAGYAASEMRGTININVGRNLCVPTLLDNFFEFVERAGWERGFQHFLTLDQLTEGGEYYVFVTTREGLYRYDMNDIVRVTEYFNETPVLAFVQKGRGVTSITGEKLHEDQVSQAISEVQARGTLNTTFFVVLADEARAEYRVYLEPDGDPGLDAEHLAAELDRRLAELNIEYAEKRASGRLNALRAVYLAPGTGEAYTRALLASGQRDAQLKVQPLQYLRDCSFNFDSQCLAALEA
jgi:hypothetical protein